MAMKELCLCIFGMMIIFTINCRNTSGTGGSVYVTSSTYFTVGVWAHVVGVYDGAYVRMYIDGVEVGTASALTGNLTSTTHDLTIARLGIGNYYIMMV